MAMLVITDLEENQQLDEQAMKAVAGGRSYPGSRGRTATIASRLQFEESKLIRGLLKTGPLNDPARS